MDEHVAPTVGSQDPGGRRLHLVVAAEIDGRIGGAVETATVWPPARNAVAIAPPIAPAPPVTTATLVTAQPPGPAKSRNHTAAADLRDISISGMLISRRSGRVARVSA